MLRITAAVERLPIFWYCRCFRVSQIVAFLSHAPGASRRPWCTHECPNVGGDEPSRPWGTSTDAGLCRRDSGLAAGGCPSVERRLSCADAYGSYLPCKYRRNAGSCHVILPALGDSDRFRATLRCAYPEAFICYRDTERVFRVALRSVDTTLLTSKQHQHVAVFQHDYVERCRRNHTDEL